MSDFTKIKGKQFDKIKFFLVSKPQYSRPEPIEDGRFLHAPLLRTQLTAYPDEVLTDIIGGREDFALGMDHVNKSRGFWAKTDSIFIR